MVAVLVWALDQLTKVLAVARLAPGDDIAVLPPVLSLTLVRNPGAAFGAGAGFTIVLSVLAVVVCVVVLRQLSRLRDRGWAWGLGLLLGGALGNLTDRMVRDPGVLRGHVVDFIAYGDWFVGNVADIALTVAAGVVVIRSWQGVRVDGTREESPR